MDSRFAGNRIFIGRYTSATPPTGYRIHPRKAGDAKHLERLRKRLERLFEASKGIEAGQEVARRFDQNALKEDNGHEATRFLFPASDGAELISRWDMQETPPDILITNSSMLSAMLAREVNGQIFDKTREWIKTDPDAYFYLVLDELHLIRGSAGTEVAGLVKTLIHRLGLGQPEFRHKLRILASSASLPTDGPAGEESLQYLWQMLGGSAPLLPPRRRWRF